MTELLDVIELTVNLPQDGLFAGMQGTVVEVHVEDISEVEFVNEQGDTLLMLALRPEQYIVVWRSKTRTWVPIAERVAALASRLPDNSGQELLDFARFLSAHRRPPAAKNPAPYAVSSARSAVREPNADPYRVSGRETSASPDV